MFKPKYRFTYDEIRIIVMALVELKNQLISEGRYTDFEQNGRRRGADALRRRNKHCQIPPPRTLAILGGVAPNLRQLLTEYRSRSGVGRYD